MVSEIQVVLILKTIFLPTSLVFDLYLKVMPLECGYEIWRQRTRMMGLPCGEEIMIVGGTMWAHSTSVTDGQTDRHIYVD